MSNRVLLLSKPVGRRNKQRQRKKLQEDKEDLHEIDLRGWKREYKERMK